MTTPGTQDLISVRDHTSTGIHALDVSRALAAQLVLAVAYIHSQGFVHGGKVGVYTTGQVQSEISLT